MTIAHINNSRHEVRGPRSLAGYIEAVEFEGTMFARAAEVGRLDVPIAACPGWDMRDLVRHVGEIHLWAAANVAYPRPKWLHVGELTDLARYWPDLATEWPIDRELVRWYRATHANLLDVLRSGPLDVAAFTFLPAPTPLTMWARRQASEIAVHRYDVEQARGLESDFAPTFASDMLDELLTGFPPLYGPASTDVVRVLRVVATDVDEQWWLRMGPSGITTSRSGSEADLITSGTAADLYIALWNRTSGSDLDLVGDPDVLDVWRNSCRVVWGR